MFVYTLTYSDESKFIIPILNINDSIQTIGKNIMTFEKCHLSDKDIYNQCLKILDVLIYTEKDVKILVHNKIIVN